MIWDSVMSEPNTIEARMMTSSQGSPFEIFMQTRRFGSLDGLRALSILAVMWHHSGLPTFGIPILERGHLGVYLFFAISGFLITSLLIRERRSTGTISMRGFYARRSLRIFPLYYAVLATYVLVVILFEKGPEGSEFFSHLPSFATYTSNWFVPLSGDTRVIFYFAWSLAAEEQFYIAWPWMERYAGPAVRMGVLALLIGTVAAVHLGKIPLFGDSLAHTVVASVAPPILFGVAVAHILHNRTGFNILWTILGQRWSAPLIAAATLALVSIPAPANAPLHTYAVYLSLTLLVVACVIRENNGLRQLLQTPLLVRLGMISYGLYLMHMLCLNVMRRVGAALGIDNAFLLWMAGVLLTCAVAEISFRTFERYFLSLKPRRPVPPAMSRV